jgi:hypothetical protein
MPKLGFVWDQVWRFEYETCFESVTLFAAFAGLQMTAEAAAAFKRAEELLPEVNPNPLSIQSRNRH